MFGPLILARLFLTGFTIQCGCKHLTLVLLPSRKRNCQLAPRSKAWSGTGIISNLGLAFHWHSRAQVVALQNRISLQVQCTGNGGKFDVMQC
ncbi:hypothetical protein V8C37DRAFT_378933 [Trichoderma ceciliae]